MKSVAFSGKFRVLTLVLVFLAIVLDVSSKKQVDRSNEVDCTTFCNIPAAKKLKQGQVLAQLRLPLEGNFQMYFEYNMQYFFSSVRNFIEITCDGVDDLKGTYSTRFRLDNRFPNVMYPYYLDKLLTVVGEYCYPTPLSFAVQPESALPTSAKPIEYFNSETITFRQDKIEFMGTAANQWFTATQTGKPAGTLFKPTTWGECTLWGSNSDELFADGVTLRNIQFRRE